MASGCSSFENSPDLLALVRLDQYIIGTLLQDINQQCIVAQSRAYDYLDVCAALCHEFKHRLPVSIGQCSVGQHDLYMQPSFKHPSGFATIAYWQHVDTTDFEHFKQR